MAIAPRVIFLDVDGVLHPADAPGGNALEDEDLFRRPCLERLAWVANHGHAAIVLSSSWRLDKDSLAEVERHLASVGLSVLDSTATDASMGPSARAQVALSVQKAETLRRCSEALVARGRFHV
ncbi:unnamed protein product [Durusdinium trenchii]|uniref:Uncharacterized protein n=1 Tax=Durusdinium trenchii TaxID=1381693 RepID=A0ABP0NGL6_9DINO